MDIPDMGLGTYSMDGEECAESVRAALDIGYRHVDTAVSYDNEAAVGEGIRRADVDRGEVFLATKIPPADLAYRDVLRAVEGSLGRLGVEAIDLLYVHWPLGAYDPDDTLRAFDELRDRGTIRGVGASNFEPEGLDEARAVLDAPILAHQVEMHPLYWRAEFLDAAREDGHRLVAYSPIARGKVAGVPAVVAVAEKHGITPAGASLAWVLAKGAAAVPKARGEHLRENWAAREIELDPEDVARIDAVEREERVVDFPPAHERSADFRGDNG